MRTFKRFVGFEKLDDELREVWGTATVEELDKQGEIVSFAGAKKAFEANAEFFQKASKGKSKGNVRAMHQPIAAGRIVAWDADEKKKSIPIGTKIDDDKEWAKCKAGTYIGFSIGGVPTKEHKEKLDGREINVIDEFELVEVSLVDNPACPSATFDVVKLAGGKVKKSDPDDEDDTPEDDDDEEELTKATDDATTVQTLIFAKKKFTVEQAKKWATDHDFRADKVDEPEGGDTIRIRQRDPGDFKEDSMRTIELKAGVQAVVGSLKISVPRFGKILKVAAPMLRKAGSEFGSIYPALCALRDLQNAMDSEAFNIAMGGDEGQEKEDIATLHVAVEQILAYLGAEFEQEVRSWTSGTGEGQATPFAFLDRLTTMQKALSPLQWKKMLDDDEMKENLDAIHRMGHGLVKASSVMGSSCPDGDCEDAGDEETEDEKPPADDAGDGDEKPSEKPSEGDEEEEEDKPRFGGNKVATPATPAAVRKGKLLAAIEKVGSEVGSVKEVVKAFDGRLKKVESAPAPIGRVPGAAVDKQLAPGSEAVTVVDETSMLKRLADAETDPERKRLLTILSVEQSVKAAQIAAGRPYGG